ncbi:MAG: hypothetical protein DRH04_04875 [Deltaproteobacteria bacterium]|nr:MAG: hypothetical protein DRH04_04875 [Deltaproteobacteria bacterium]
MKRFLLLVLVVLALVVPAVAGASFLEEEAGISATAKLSTVDLNLAAVAYKNIERQTDDYIVGSIAIDDYPESDDVHVYLDVSGDIIAYYRNTEDICKMLDWRHYTAGQPMSTKLEWALNKICQAMSITLPDVKIYDFRYPQAQQIKIIVDERLNSSATEDFRVKIPSNYTLYRVGWSVYIKDEGGYGSTTTTTLYIDENIAVNQLYTGGTGGWLITQGEVSDILIAADNTYHTVYFTGDKDGDIYTAIVIVYTEN